MIVLDKNTKSLQILSTVADLQWTASWVAVKKDCQGINNLSELNSETQGVTIIGIVTPISAPTQNTNSLTFSDEIEYISVYNNSGSSAVVTIQIDDAGTPRILFKLTLPQGYQIIYNEDSGWQIFDENGALPSPSGTALTDGHIFVGSAVNIATDVAMSGEASIINTGAVTLLNSAVIGKVLTGYVSGAGTVAATDNILQAIQKLNGNIGALVTGVSSVSGTTNRITASPTTGAVVVDISASYVGQSSITTLGTITTGVWTATAVGDSYIASALTGKTYNGLSITSTTGTLTIAAGKVLTQNNTLTYNGNDGATINFGAGGTATFTSNNLAVFSSTTSAQLASVISDETGSGLLVFATSPTLITPVLGVATATTINKVTITAPATSATLTIAQGSSLITSGAFSLTLTTTATTSATFPTGTITIVDLASAQSLTNKTLAATSIIAGVTMTLGSDAVGDLYYGGTSNVLTRLAAGAAGKFLMFNGVGAAPIVSTLVLPNSGTSTYIPYFTSANTIGETSNMLYNGNQINFFGASACYINNAGFSFGSSTNFATATTPIYTQGSNNGGQAFQCYNSNTSTAAFARLTAQSSGCFSLLQSQGSGYTTSGAFIQSGTLVYGDGSGGLALTAAHASGTFKIYTGGTAAANLAVTISTAQLLGIGLSPTKGYLEIKGGTTTVAPITLTSGTNKTTASAGDIEYNGTNLFFTRTGTTRENVLVAVDNASAPSTSVGVGIVNFYGAAATNFLGDPNRWASVNILGSVWKIPLYS